MIDEADIHLAKTVVARIDRAFYVGVGLGLILGFWTTVLGMWLAWAVWQWFLA